MVTFPPCKINLGLTIRSKRPDGYHDIQTCFIPLPWTDVLEILPSDQLTFSQTGLAIPGDPEDNLCLKAYHLIQKELNLPPVHFHLHKIIPMGAGLGGGSSDAAYTLRMLNSVFGLNLTSGKLMEHAKSIGTDCTFFIQDQPAIGRERGDILEPVNLQLSGLFVLLVKPEIHVSTHDAYQRVVPQIVSPDIRSMVEQPVKHWKDKLTNDFEATIFRNHPALASIKKQLYSLGAIYASMSGSGSCMYGIFDKEIRPKDHFSNLVCWACWL